MDKVRCEVNQRHNVTLHLYVSFSAVYPDDPCVHMLKYTIHEVPYTAKETESKDTSGGF